MASTRPITNRRLVQLGDFELDCSTGELRQNDVKVRLQEQPLKILQLLLERPGELVSREQIQQRLWPDGTFVEFEHSVNAAIKRLREALGDSVGNPKFIETIPRRGYRLIAPIPSADTGRGVALVMPARVVGPTSKTPTAAVIRQRRRLRVLAAAAVLALSFAGYFSVHRTPKLTDKDTLVLADFTNTTGDSAFDVTLRQGLAIQLEQSPFLSLVSEERIRRTLRLMGQPPEARLVPSIAREVCQRTGGAAVLDGSIATLGDYYVLGLRAVNCRTGDTLAEEQERATSKVQVLGALDMAAANLRKKLGESLRTVEKLNRPLEQATTPSLDALQAYSLGRKIMVERGDLVAAATLFQRAILFDPNFAMAYASLGTTYQLGETGLAAENTKKAYELRDRVSERERLYIESHYYQFVTGDLEKARQTYELWAQTYPRDWLPVSGLGTIDAMLGQYDKRLVEKREALRLDPESGWNHAAIVLSYIYLNRLAEARTAAEEAQGKNLDSPLLRIGLYELSFLENDAAGMAQQVAWSAGKPGLEDVLLAAEGESAAYLGRLARARDFTRQAVASAQRAGKKERAASYEAGAALREGLFGDAAEARKRAAAALELSTARDVQYGAALALVLAGQASRAHAEQLAGDLAKRFPRDTIVQFSYLPTIHAHLALTSNSISKATEELKAAGPSELSASFIALYPVYVRGEAYLAAHRGSAAAAEFQKILDHPGLVLNEPIGALARLQIGRAYALAGDSTKAKSSYQDFLRLWKDADIDSPILQQAKAEYANLR